MFDDDATQEIPLPNVKTAILAKVVEFMKHHKDEIMTEIEKVNRSLVSFLFSDTAAAGATAVVAYHFLLLRCLLHHGGGGGSCAVRTTPANSPTAPAPAWSEAVEAAGWVLAKPRLAESVMPQPAS